jgi:hypothetical protein
MQPHEFTDIFIKQAKPIPNEGSPTNRWIASHGLCWYWAYAFVQVMGGEIYSYQTKDRSGHCFVKYKGFFYDSETFEGKVIWKNLQTYLKKTSDSKLKKHQTIGGFLKSWGLNENHVQVFNDTIKEIQLTRSMDRF